MYYNTAKVFLISLLVSLFTSVIVCLVFFFVVPMTRSGGEVEIPNVVGSTTEQARVILESKSLLLMVGGEEDNDKYGENIIFRQTPLPGSTVRSKSTITVFISKGTSASFLPDLKGMGLSEATARLSQLNLKIGEVRTEENSSVEKDKIVSTVPPAGSRIRKDDMITIVLSSGAQLGDVPRLVGRALSTAKRLIEEGGFEVGSVSYEVSTEINVGIIISQSPSAGTKLKKGSKINLVVATVLE
ncbi:MAG TPA: PASTA domain-containing protein [bacterium]